MPLQLEASKISKTQQLLSQAERIVIMAHVNPDGDAVGSTLGFYHMISSQMPTKATTVVLPNRVPETFKYLPGWEMVIDAESNLEASKNAISRADLIFCLDFGQFSRVGVLQEALAGSLCKKILMDHHQNADMDCFEVGFSYPSISSASELVYWISKELWGNVNQDASRCLFNGICTDTGSFAYSCSEPNLYEAAGALVAHDINPADIHNQIFNAFSIEKMEFLGFCLNQRMKIFKNYHFAYIYISAQDMERFHVKESDTEGFVNYTLMMKEIEVGALIKEKNGEVRISLRSKKDFDVNSYAQRHFNGGGHIKAAGATSTFSLNETVGYVEYTMLQELFKYLNK